MILPCSLSWSVCCNTQVKQRDQHLAYKQRLRAQKLQEEQEYVRRVEQEERDAARAEREKRQAALREMRKVQIENNKLLEVRVLSIIDPHHPCGLDGCRIHSPPHPCRLFTLVCSVFLYPRFS